MVKIIRILGIVILLLVFHAVSFAQQEKVTISGFVKEKGSLEPLLGVNIYIPELHTGGVTNTYGFYSLTLPKGDSLTLIFSYVGYEALEAYVPMNKDLELMIELQTNRELSEVVVEAKKEVTTTEQAQMSKIDIPVYAIKNLPALFGEKDALKTIQLMPGVQSGSEGQSGLYVRGGGPDQNLIILDDATVYNAYHLFGFFSLFNGDAIRSIELTKGGFPARYGGRLSSVLDINMKEGSKETLKGEAGIGLISSRVTLEGPIAKGKSSFLVSGRRTYIDALIQPFVATAGYNAGYFFQDFTGKVNFDLGKKDRLFLSAYTGKDKFYYRDRNLGLDTRANMQWGNLTSTLRWNHVYNPKTFSNLSAIFSQYNLNIGFESKFDNEKFDMRFTSGIRDFTLKYDVDYMPNTRNTFKFGAISTYHTFTPNAVVIKESSSNLNIEDIERVETFESGVYVQDDIRLSYKWRMLAGLRLSHFVVGSYQTLRPEPRFSTSYMLGKRTSIKGSFAEMNQYIHLLSNTGVGLPTDLWVPATERIKPQRSRQVAAGISHDIRRPELTVSLEGYYKRSYDIIAYREGASFLAVDDPFSGKKNSWENNVTTGNAEAYGMELLIEKKKGKFTGWVGYTLAWIWHDFNDLNNGKRFHPKYDRRHDISVVGIYEFSENFTFSATWVYGTGNAISLPLAYHNQYGTPDQNDLIGAKGYGTYYGDKNTFRMAAYHRFDVSLQFHKQKPRFERTWEFSLYNAYNRKNPYFYYVNYGATRNTLKQVTLFPLLPSISYNIKF
ncbi:MAG: TonB-dependent receptor [Bacteroidota bacterium]|nr:TonB-dependent receptor [Bacteroidota bacterium]MDX5430429.1 TonB-dependent receptor [Bacteroidota bacterium]MDX5469188.1 TonB-dependent receptor [Bacteroidota bacterium]